jgi:hypothetical protein
MKNKPDPALLRPSNLSNEIKKRVPKSRETIPFSLTGMKQNILLLQINILLIAPSMEMKKSYGFLFFS